MDSESTHFILKARRGVVLKDGPGALPVDEYGPITGLEALEPKGCVLMLSLLAALTATLLLSESSVGIWGRGTETMTRLSGPTSLTGGLLIGLLAYAGVSRLRAYLRQRSQVLAAGFQRLRTQGKLVEATVTSSSREFHEELEYIKVSVEYTCTGRALRQLRDSAYSDSETREAPPVGSKMWVLTDGESALII